MPLPSGSSGSSIWDVFDASRSERAQLTIWDGTRFRPLSWGAWRSQALVAAGALRELGVVGGTRVACLLTNCEGACVTLIGGWLAGATVVSLPTPAPRMSPEAYAAQLRHILEETGAMLVLAEARFAEHFAEVGLGERRVVAYERLASHRRIEPDPVTGRDTALIQYSSGSTSEPRGCLLSMAAIEWELATLGEALELAPWDRCVSWLPLSHDMGLFGCLMLSFTTGMELVLGTPERFIRSPRSWLADIADSEATCTAAPNFAFELAHRAAVPATRAPGASLRLCVIAGERVDAGTLDRACERLGIPRVSLINAYGLAEAVLTVAMTPVRAEPRVLARAREALERGAVHEVSDVEADGATVRLVSCGRCLPGKAVRVAGDGDVGELWVRSPSLADGYVGRSERTRERFVDGELCTGDLGFVRDGELYVVDRVDDQMNVAGRKIWARDVETSLGCDAEVRPGGCVVVDVAGPVARRLVALVEPAEGIEDHDALAARLGLAAARGGVTLAECLVVARGTLPRTPSGKIQRHHCRELVQDRDLTVLGSLSGSVRQRSSNDARA